MDAFVLLLTIAGILFLIFVFGMIGDRRSRNETLSEISSSYGKKSSYRLTQREREHIRSFFDNHKSDGQIDDITWNDLQMDDIFTQMNYTQSRIGSEYLYYLLRTPQERKDIADKEEYYMQHEKERDALMLQFHDMGRYSGSSASVYDFLELIEKDRHFSPVPFILMDAALAASIIFMVFVPSWGILVFLGVIIMNMLIYFSRKHEADPYLKGFSYTLGMLDAAKSTRRLVRYGGFSEEASKLDDICSSLRPFSAGSFILMSRALSNPLEIIFEYIRMILGVDMIKFGQMLNKARACRDDIDRLASVMGYMDSVLSISFYRAYLGERYCRPEFTYHESDLNLSVEGMYDPLIKEPVCNSVKTSKSVLITGSNASGKSTFLKTLAVCALMAETIGICPAVSYKAPYFRIMSAMSTSDDIMSGNSYYVSEIKAIRRMIDEVGRTDTDIPVICFIDEILRGTNTVERIAASAQILRFFGNGRSLCFAATHDIELTSMLDGIFRNFHFKEEMKDGIISFPYILFEGRAQSRNAIKLLGAMGYDKDIVDNAERSAEDFISKGEWHI